VQTSISKGRYKNTSEVIRAGLRLLEVEKSKFLSLKAAIKEGIDSGVANDFDAQQHLVLIKAKRRY